MSPRVFISHASEDKERFVLEFATKLREKGVDAWLDRWEMLPSDSLVDKIFEEGIGKATAFIIVLSQYSVRKKWVQEELNAAVVKRLEKGTKVIPVLIDDVEVPESLKPIVWIHISNLNDYEDEFDRIVQSIFGVYQKPPLGEPPKYVQLSIDVIPDLNQTDTLILKLACEYIQEELGYNFIEADECYKKIEEHDISRGSFDDTLQILDSRGYINGTRAANDSVMGFSITTFGFEEYARIFIPNYNEQIESIALHLINHLKLGKTIELC